MTSLNDTNQEATPQAVSLPEGMVEVTKEEFFASVGQMNVHPRPEEMWSDWIDQRTTQLLGRTTPGYLCEGDERYMVAVSLRKAVAA